MFGENKEYWWVVANYEGRKVILGAFNTNEDAYQEGYSKIDGDFETVALPTRDMGRAVRMLRMRGEEGLADSLRRTRHTI